MRFRWKLLAIMLAISILPIAVGRTFGHRAVKTLGEELVSMGSSQLI